MFGSSRKQKPKVHRIRLDGPDVPIRRGDSYISARVLSQHVPRTGRKRHVFALWSITVPHPTMGDIPFQRLEAPSFLGQTDISQIDRVEEANQRILGTIPFHDDVNFEIGLFSAPVDGKADHYLNLIAQLGEVAATDFFLSTIAAPAMPVLDLVNRGLNFAIDQRSDSPIDLEVMSKFALDGEHIQPGNWLVVFGDVSPKELAKMRFDAATGKIVGPSKNGEAPLDLPHIAFAIDTEPSRADWFRIPDVLEAWDFVRQAVNEDAPTAEINAEIARFRRTCMTSPDLITEDARQLAAMVEQSFLEITGQAEDMRDEEMTRSPEMFGMSVMAKEVGKRVRHLGVGDLRDFVTVKRLRDLGTEALKEAERRGIVVPPKADPPAAGGTQQPVRAAPQTPPAGANTAPAPDTPTPIAIAPVPVPATPAGPVSAPPAASGIPGWEDPTPLSVGAEEKFQVALKFTKGWEGGYVNDPADRGGETNYGITQATLNRFRSQNGLAAKSVADITFPEAEAIYREDYFEAANCHKMPEKIAVAVFDARVNHRPRWAGKFLQHGINSQATLPADQRVDVDGFIGQQTLDALKNCDEMAILQTFCDKREAYYKSIVERSPSQARFLNGWLNRNTALRKFVGLRVAENFRGAPEWTPKTPGHEDEDWLDDLFETDDQPLVLADLDDAILDAVEDGDHIGQAVDDIITILRGLPRGDITSDPQDNIPYDAIDLSSANRDAIARRVMGDLKGRRADAALADVATALMLSDIGGATAWRHAAQSKIELGQYDDAMRLSREMLARFNSDHDYGERLTAVSMMARIAKQRYMDIAAHNEAEADPRDLIMAAEIYERAFSDKVETLNEKKKNASSTTVYGPYYEGINALALALRGDRSGISVLPKLMRDVRITSLRHYVEAAMSDPKEALWATLTLAEIEVAEAELAPSNRAANAHYDAALAIIVDVLKTADQKQLFHLASFSRQLNEVWQLASDTGQADAGDEPSRAPNLLATLNLALMRFTGDAGNALTTDAVETMGQLADYSAIDHVADARKAEKNFGNEGQYTIDTYVNFLKQFKSATVNIKSRRLSAGSGTGFIMDGKALSHHWAGRTVLVTNWHVIAVNSQGNAIKPEDAVAHFEGLPGSPSRPVGRVLWGSEFAAHDCCILDMDLTDLDGVQPIEFFAETPPNPDRDTTGFGHPIGSVNVIGHPKGGAMSIGTSGLHLHQYTYLTHKQADGSEIKIAVLHYNSPTEPGNSGSPVIDMRTLELCGLHHASAHFQKEVFQRSAELAPHRRGVPMKRRKRRRPPAPRRAARSTGAVLTLEHAECNEGIWLAGIRDAIGQWPQGLTSQPILGGFDPQPIQQPLRTVTSLQS